MKKDVLSIRQLGEETCWTLVQQAIGIPDSTVHTDFLSEKVFVLFFAQTSLPERLCISAAIRQMGGDIVYETDPTGEHWLHEMHEHQLDLLPIFNFYLNGIYLYGIPLTSFKGQDINLDFPTINAGSPDAHPAHALADIAYMVKANRYLSTIPCAWLGTPNGTLYSLIAASRWFPMTLRLHVPENSDTNALAQAMEDAPKVTLVDSIEEAVRDVKFLFVGSRVGIGYPRIKDWEISASVLQKADPQLGLFLAARPINCLPIERDLLSSKMSLLLQQSEYRLRIHKRILHYVFA
ncbi:MAG: ornithine carbamoyltransferase [Desulfovibrio sp.]|nr:ornithine carbamoyltransferase [Desulfovibrio sp.]